MAQSVAPISNHDELGNLAYADAGHTGFVATVNAPIESGTGDGSVQVKAVTGVGQITLTNGSNAVTGTGTEFIGDSGFNTLNYWWQIYVNGVAYYFDDVTTETTAVLSVNWAGSTQTIDLVFTENSATGVNSVVLGQENKGNATGAVAVGGINTVTGGQGVAIGVSQVVSASHGVAIGSNNQIDVDCDYSVALGYSQTITNALAFALGNLSSVAGLEAGAMGTGLVAPATREIAVGAYNTSYTPANNSTDRAFVVGNGADNGNRSNAFFVRKNGNAELSGMLTAAQLTVTGTVDFSGQTAVVDPDAITTTQTADMVYTQTEVDMLNALKADVTALRATVLALTNALQAIGFN